MTRAANFLESVSLSAAHSGLPAIGNTTGAPIPVKVGTTGRRYM
nr:hypothetical protein [Gordonia sp. i37]